MPTVKPDTLIKQHPDTAWRILEDILIAVTPHDSKIHRFNKSATRIWQLLGSSGMTVAALTQALVGRYHTDPHQTGKEVSSFVTRALRCHLLTTG